MRETGSLLAQLSVPIRPRFENSFCITWQKKYQVHKRTKSGSEIALCQQAFTCSKLIIETLEQGVKYVQC